VKLRAQLFLKKFKAARVFTFFLTPLLIFNYIGTNINSESSVDNPIAYWFFVVLWEVLGFVDIYRTFSDTRVRKKFEGGGTCSSILCGPVLYWFVCAFILTFTIANAVTKAVEIASMFLYIVVICVFVAVVRLGSTSADTSGGRIWFLGFLALCTLVFWVAALRYFSLAVTDKTLAPAASRALNQDCVLLNYFDVHDVWHLLSAIALAFSLLFVINIHPPENESLAPFPELEPFIEPTDSLRPEQEMVPMPPRSDDSSLETGSSEKDEGSGYTQQTITEEF